jgi:hypothetical protein
VTRRLAVFYDAGSPSFFELAEAARDVCSLVWVIGWSAGSPPRRGLARFGEVADLSGKDVDQSAKMLAGLGVDGLLALTDPPLKLAAAVAEQLGLPFHSPSTAALCTDKLLQRQALRAAGVPVPCHEAIRVGQTSTYVPFPAVLKPRSGAGSRNTYRIEGVADLADAWSRVTDDEAFILEQWLPDRQTGPFSDVVSVETIVRNGSLEHVDVTGRFRFAPPFRETGSFSPACLTPPETDAAKVLAGEAITALGIAHGLVHTEVKFTPEPRVIEVNGRLGGLVAALLVRRGRASMSTIAMHLALGDHVEAVAPGSSDVSFLRLLPAPEGVGSFMGVEGQAMTNGLTGVEGVTVKPRAGQTVDSDSGLLSYLSSVRGSVATHAQLAELCAEIDATMRFSFDLV